MSQQHSIESENCGSVKELQQWLSKFGDCNREHYYWNSRGQMKKSPTSEEKMLAIPYAMKHGRAGGRPDPKSVSSNSSQSTSVASPPQPIRTIDGSVFEPRRETQTKTSSTRFAQEQRSSTTPIVQLLESTGLTTETASKKEVSEWRVSDRNENERVRIIATSDVYAAATTHSIMDTSVKTAEPTTLPSFDQPSNDSVVDEIFQCDSAIPGLIRRKVPLLFCKSRRESKELLIPTLLQTKTKTVMFPTTTTATKDSSGCQSNGQPARWPTETDSTEAQDNDYYFQLDDYWNDSSIVPSPSDQRLRETSAAPPMRDITTSLVHVFEKEVALELNDNQSLSSTEIKSPPVDKKGGPNHSLECDYSCDSAPSQSGSYNSRAKTKVSDLSSMKNRPQDAVYPSISSKHSQLKVMTPPRNEISEKIEQFGGRMKPKKMSSVQTRMAELERKWAESKQVEHNKAIKWEALNGAYKKRIFLEQKGLP